MLAESAAHRGRFLALLDACNALGDYPPRMRKLMLFAAYERMRPSELYALHELKIDFERARILKDARIWKEAVGQPETGGVIIPMTPPGWRRLSS